jgi:hypothetical protein
MPDYLDTLSNDILKQSFHINDEPNTHYHNQSRIQWRQTEQRASEVQTRSNFFVVIV